MTKFYIGYDTQGHRWQTFSADTREEATPEETGYFAVSAPIDTSDEAQTICDAMNIQMSF